MTYQLGGHLEMFSFIEWPGTDKNFAKNEEALGKYSLLLFSDTPFKLYGEGQQLRMET